MTGMGQVHLEWVLDSSDCYTGSSSDGWGTRALIVPPEIGDGETFYWEVYQNGWTWDGREESLEQAKATAVVEANRMLTLPGVGEATEQRPRQR